jgi:hypothetical protein
LRERAYDPVTAGAEDEEAIDKVIGGVSVVDGERWEVKGQASC